MDRPEPFAIVFRPWIVDRADGCSQVLIPLAELNNLVIELVARVAGEARCYRIQCNRRLCQPVTRTCRKCGLPFMPFRRDNRFCSTKCRNSYWQRQHRQRLKRDSA
jgi:uncharacterized protein with PIN domain